MERRKFIAASIGALAAVSTMPSCILGSKPKEGEEWRLAERNSLYTLEYSAADQDALEQALKNIEIHRKRNVSIRLFDQQGLPLRNTTVKIVQTNTPFDWGSSSSVGSNKNRTKLFLDLFNCATAKCYWDERWHQPIEKVEGKRIYDVFLNEIKTAKDNGLRVKGHPLVWTVRKALPQWLDAYPLDKQLEILKNHVQSLISIGGKDVTRWDLCNEMLWEPSFRNYKNRKWPHIETVDEMLTHIAPAVQWAREINPNALYSLNDYGLEITYVKEITAAEQRKRYVELAKALKRRGCAPDALGTQTHVGGWYSPSLLKTVWDDLSQAEIPLQITEFWAHFDAEPAVQKLKKEEQDFYRQRYVNDCITMAFGHPSVNHFTFWGDDMFFDEQGNATPVYEGVHNLIKKEWTTTLNLNSGDEALVSFRGFKGNYKVFNGDTVVKEFELLEDYVAL